jgi:hypothetical protein
MRVSGWIAAAALATVAVSATAKPKKKSEPVSKLFCQASYVYVETPEGDADSPNAFPNDREAVSAMEDKLDDWHRYSVVYRASEAELIFLVRPGRAGTVSQGPTMPGQPEVNIGRRAPGSPGTGSPGAEPGEPLPPGDATELGSSEDMLTILEGPMQGSTMHTVLWRKSETDGLSSPDVPLFQQLQKAVDSECGPVKTKPAAQ